MPRQVMGAARSRRLCVGLNTPRRVWDEKTRLTSDVRGIGPGSMRMRMRLQDFPGAAGRHQALVQSAGEAFLKFSLSRRRSDLPGPTTVRLSIHSGLVFINLKVFIKSQCHHRIIYALEAVLMKTKLD